MLYAILCYDSEDAVGAWTQAQDDDAMAKLAGRLGPIVRLLPTTCATTLRTGRVYDGPFARTREQLLGLYVVDCATLDAALDAARDLAHASSSAGAFEVRPLAGFRA
jgi:hypothetical protein